MSALPALVSKFGLWWPEADPGELKQAAAAWNAFGGSIERIGPIGDAAANRLASDNDGRGIEAGRAAWTTLAGNLTQTAGMARGQADMLLQYCANCEDARSQILEIAATIAATVAAGAALSFVTFGAAGAGAAGAVAALVAAAEAVGITLSTTVAAIIVGAAECVLLDVAVAQPIRIYAFDRGGWSLPEAGLSAIGGGIGGGAGAKWQAWRGTNGARPLAAAGGAGAAGGGRAVVTEQTIRDAMKGAPLRTVQEDASLPKVQRFVKRLDEGEQPPPIVVQDDVVLDGSHRYIAGRIAGREPKVVKAEDIGFPPLEKGEEILPFDRVRIDRLERPDDEVPIQ